ncbi:M3 family metallopeptidase [Corynebacterium tapiri]
MLTPSTLPYGLPPFAQITPAFAEEALERGMEEQSAEIAAIKTGDGSWESVVEGLERSGATLDRGAAWLFNMQGTDANDEIDALAERMIPRLTAHSAAIYQDQDLYRLVREVDVPEDEESRRLHRLLVARFERQGAGLDDAGQKRLREIDERLAVLGDAFRRHLAADTKDLAVRFDSADELEGLSSATIEAARQEDGSFVLPLELPTVQAALSELKNKQARQKVLEASLKRGSESNRDTLVEMVRLRAERAELLGFKHHADFIVAEETADDADAAWALLTDLAPAASANAEAERKLAGELAQEEITAADWPYFAARLAEGEDGVSDAELRAYFPLRSVLENGVFAAARRLYGIEVKHRPDLEGYRDDVDVWEVSDSDGSGIGLLLTDYHARSSKRGGAWMSTFMDQAHLTQSKPVVVNVMSITDENLTPDEVTTVFHEFGHALHGLLSDVRYPSLSGTNVPRDWVEFPSQINENWAFDPAIVPLYARHAETGEVIPAEYVEAIQERQRLGQGFGTAEYLAAAIIDLAWHRLTPAEAEQVGDIEEFEKDALAAAGLEVESLHPRYKSTYFNHIFGGGYSAGYYSYLWAEALDADGFDWFTEVGAAGEKGDDAKAREAGQRFRDLVLSRGAAADYAEAFESLRGRPRSVQALLKRRGLAGSRVEG